MPTINIDIKARIDTLSLVDGLTDQQKQTVKDKFTAAGGDWDKFVAALPVDFVTQFVAKLKWANRVGDWSLVIKDGKGTDDKPLAEAILKDGSITSLRDLAL